MVPCFPLPRFPPPAFLTLPRFPLLRFQSPSRSSIFGQLLHGAGLRLGQGRVLYTPACGCTGTMVNIRFNILHLHDRTCHGRIMVPPGPEYGPKLLGPARPVKITARPVSAVAVFWPVPARPIGPAWSGARSDKWPRFSATAITNLLSKIADSPASSMIRPWHLLLAGNDTVLCRRL